MENWDINSLPIEPHQPQVLRSDDETRAIAIQLPSGEERSKTHAPEEKPEPRGGKVEHTTRIEGEQSCQSAARNHAGGTAEHYGPQSLRVAHIPEPRRHGASPPLRGC